MTLTSILVTLVLLLALYVKWRFIKVPKGYTFIAHFDKPTKVLSITGSPDDSRSWYLMSPFEKRLTVKLEVYKVMELDLAQKKQAELKAMNDPNESLSIISTFDEVKKDNKDVTTTSAIVKRRTLAKKLEVKELQAIYVRHNSKDGAGITAKGEIDTVQAYNRTYTIKDAASALKLYLEEENWITAADNLVEQFFTDYGVKQSFEKIKETSLDQIIDEVDYTPKLKDLTDTKSLENYFNEEFFKDRGFTISNLTKRPVHYGPNSRDIFQTKEDLARKQAENAIQDEVNNQTVKNAQTVNDVWTKQKVAIGEQVDLQIKLYKGQGEGVKLATSGTFSNTPLLQTAYISNDNNASIQEAIKNVPVIVDLLNKQKPREEVKKPEQKGENQTSKANQKPDKQNKKSDQKDVKTSEDEEEDSNG